MIIFWLLPLLSLHTCFFFQIDRLVAVAGEEQLRELSHVFTHSVDKSMADDHLWFSVFLRPPRSRFTRVQRLSSCMALLYLSMLVNAMFYQKVWGFLSFIVLYYIHISVKYTDNHCYQIKGKH